MLPSTTPWDGMPEEGDFVMEGAELEQLPVPRRPWWRRLGAWIWSAVLKYMGAPR